MQRSKEIMKIEARLLEVVECITRLKVRHNTFEALFDWLICDGCLFRALLSGFSILLLPSQTWTCTDCWLKIDWLMKFSSPSIEFQRCFKVNLRQVSHAIETINHNRLIDKLCRFTRIKRYLVWSELYNEEINSFIYKTLVADLGCNHSVHRCFLNTHRYPQCRHHNIAIAFEPHHHKFDYTWPMESTRTIFHSLDKFKSEMCNKHVTLKIYQKWTVVNLKRSLIRKG